VLEEEAISGGGTSNPGSKDRKLILKNVIVDGGKLSRGGDRGLGGGRNGELEKSIASKKGHGRVHQALVR